MDVAKILQYLSYRYALQYHQKFAFEMFILGFATTIIHQQFVAMLRGYMRFVLYTFNTFFHDKTFRFIGTRNLAAMCNIFWQISTVQKYVMERKYL